MDARLQANPQLHYAVNGRVARPGNDGALNFLSQEEQECIQFFDHTIDSLEESLKEDDRNPGTMRSSAIVGRAPVNNNGDITGPPRPAVGVSSALTTPLGPKDQDIIDLVRPGPDLVQPIFNPSSPDFQNLVQTPESHFEMRPRRDAVDHLPSEYNPPLPSGSYVQSDSHGSYHPPGCIPTPVLIAQQIAENQAGGGASNLPPPPPSYSVDHQVKQGPPTSAKPTRYPANISVILGSKELHNPSLSNVNIQERRAQMLANLTGSSHPLLPDDPTQQWAEQKALNAPGRSISFRDPTPDKSRMEALNKLGLSRSRAMSAGTSLLPSHTFVEPGGGVAPVEVSLTPATPKTANRSPDINIMTSTQIQSSRNNEILHTSSLRSLEDRNLQPSRRSSSPPPPPDPMGVVVPPAEVTSLEFNSYGGKSIVVNPSFSTRMEPPTSPSSPEPRLLSPVLAKPSEFNTYGGKTKVMQPRNDLPDILSSHISKSQTLPAKSEPLPIELNSYGGKSRTFNAPSAGSDRGSENQARGFKAPVPTPAPRPHSHSFHGGGNQQKAPQQTPTPDKRRSGSMFRPQGITVQFSGKGASKESRQDALKKLGLLKDS